MTCNAVFRGVFLLLFSPNIAICMPSMLKLFPCVIKYDITSSICQKKSLPRTGEYALPSNMKCALSLIRSMPT